jgi:hypothetical protein
MKLLASLAFGTVTFLAAIFGLAAPAAADDDVSIGVKLGPLCVGLCIDGDVDHDGGYRYDNDYYDGGFYAHRENYYHQRYDRRPYPDYAEVRDDCYAGYRRHGGKHHGRGHHGDNGHDNGDDGNGNGNGNGDDEGEDEGDED